MTLREEILRNSGLLTENKYSDAEIKDFVLELIKNSEHRIDSNLNVSKYYNKVLNHKYTDLEKQYISKCIQDVDNIGDGSFEDIEDDTIKKWYIKVLNFFK